MPEFQGFSGSGREKMKQRKNDEINNYKAAGLGSNLSNGN
jgi:hypothetical protein